jgi:hypothetical protein
MGFVKFMLSPAGRLLRVALGIGIMWYGLVHLGGTLGIAVGLIGLVPIAAGLFNFCLLGPLFGVDLAGRVRSGS